jgi:uncharacterized protein
MLIFFNFLIFLIHRWGIATGAAEPPPTSPVTSSHPTQSLTLLPFGATKLRIAELPTLKN